jgi:RHS repeat-associated protein
LTVDGHDANGNTITSEGHSYTYDFEDRLIAKDGNAITVVYDGDGERVAKTVGGVTTKYLVDGLNPTGYWQVLEETASGAVQTRYTYGTSIVSETTDVAGLSTTSYYGYDGHGNITFLTDTNGVVTDQYQYDSWGNVLARTGATANTRFYAGEEIDPDLGLINLRARQYKATVGRFVSADAQFGNRERPATLNRYLYADGDPTNRVDPTGHATAEEYGVVLGGILLGTIVEIVNKGNPQSFCVVGAGGAGAYMAVVVASPTIGLLVAAAFSTLCLETLLF